MLVRIGNRWSRGQGWLYWNRVLNIRSAQPPPMMRLSTFIMLLTLAAAWGAGDGSCRADRFVLANGGHIEGQWLNPDDSPRETYVIETAEGGRVVLAAELVEAVETLSPVEQRYLEILPRMPNTVEGLWKMAEWCRESSLNTEREIHLEQLLRLDPDHKGARLALGYTKVDGVWARPEDRMRGLGYVRSGGSWRLPQEIAIQARKGRIDDAHNQWRRDVKNLRGQVGKRRGPEAVAQLRAIRDPMAAPALVELLNGETLPEMAVLYIEVLGQLNHPAATAALVKHALENGDERVRDLCLDHLVRRGEHGAVAVFTRALTHKENYMVNRAAVALARMGDERAIIPLIDALTTKHKHLVSQGGAPGGIGASFSPNGGGGGLSMGGKPKIVEQEVQNPAVLQALTALTQAHHGYRKDAWKAWYAAQNTPRGINLRREL